MVAGITVGAFLLRLLALEQGLYGDELFTYSTVVGHSLRHVLDADLQNNPPLFYVLAWASAKLGNPDTSIRLPSLVLGTATVPVVYALGLRTAGPLAGVLGAAIVGLSPFSVYYGVEARGYAAVMFFSALSTWLLLGAMNRGGRRRWALYAAASLAVVYSHYLGIFVLLAQLAWAAWSDRRLLRPLLVANAVVAIGCLPLIGALGGERVTEAPVRAASVLRESLRIVSGVPETSWSEVPGNLGGAALIAAAAATLAAAVFLLVKAPAGSRLPSGRSRIVLLALLAVATPVGFVLYSLVGSSIVLGRYMLPSLPAIALLLGALLDRIPRKLSLAILGLAVIGLGIGAVRSLRDQYERPDYREPAHFIDRAFRPGDVIVDQEISQFVAGQAFLSRGIAGRDETYLAVHLDPDHRAFRVSTLDSAVTATAPSDRLFVVAREAQLQPAGALPVRLIETRSFPGVRTVAVRVYERTPDTDQKESQGRSLAILRRCLSQRGLQPRPTDAPAGAVALTLTLPRGPGGLLLLYRNPRDAAGALGGVRSLMARTGGEAERAGSVVTGYLGQPSETDLRRVNGCLER